MSFDAPTILSAVGTGVQAAGTMRSARSDAGALEQQASVARSQSLQDEYATRRAGRQRLGTLAASMAQAGGGVDEGLLRQSGINAELDALNTRYAGFMRAAGYDSRAKSLRRDSKLMAGAQLLSGASSIYRQSKTGTL